MELQRPKHRFSDRNHYCNTSYGPATLRWTLLALVLIIPCALAQGQRGEPRNLPKGMTPYESPYYKVYTDVDPETAREAVIRMTKMAEAYHERTAAFSGIIREKLPFYLFNTEEEYNAAGGMVGSAGVFDGSSLKATAIKDEEGHINHGTWHVVQHEGFHQFVHAVIRGDIPTWTNEGLAEYFGEGIFTGDGIITGVIPPQRLKRIQEEISEKKYKPFPKIMLMDGATWNKTIGADDDSAEVNYDEAWSMVHFLAHAEGGKYQRAFSAFMYDVGQGQPWERAWLQEVGPADGFEEKWKNYWSKLPENPTLDLYTQASVASLTSFIGRAYAQKQTFDNFDELARTDAKSMKASEADWLPPSLFTAAMGFAQRSAKLGNVYAITIEPHGSKMPKITCTLSSGAKLVGHFTLSGGRIAKVQVDNIPVPPVKKVK